MNTRTKKKKSLKFYSALYRKTKRKVLRNSHMNPNSSETQLAGSVAIRLLVDVKLLKNVGPQYEQLVS